MKKFIPGLRIIKTFTAVFICFVIFFALDYYRPIHALIACVLMMRETSEETRIVGLQRVKGTILGGFLSFVTLILLDHFNIPSESLWSALMISLSLLVSFTICKGFETQPYVATMSGVVLLITLVNHADSTQNIFSYVGIRVLETLVGIFIAFLVNRYMNFKFLKS